jgi:hypothetical protein
MPSIMSLRHHRTKNFSIPALFMPRLLAITTFPGFVYVFNNNYFWLWYSRLWTCDIFIVITKRSYFLIQIPLITWNCLCQRVLRLFGKGIQVAKETSSYRLVYAIWVTKEKSRCYGTVVSIIPWGISHRLRNILQGFCWIMPPLHLKKK